MDENVLDNKFSMVTIDSDDLFFKKYYNFETDKWQFDPCDNCITCDEDKINKIKRMYDDTKIDDYHVVVIKC